MNKFEQEFLKKYDNGYKFSNEELQSYHSGLETAKDKKNTEYLDDKDVNIYSIRQIGNRFFVFRYVMGYTENYAVMIFDQPFEVIEEEKEVTVKIKEWVKRKTNEENQKPQIKKNEWIPVEQGLPEDMQDILFTTQWGTGEYKYRNVKSGYCSITEEVAEEDGETVIGKDIRFMERRSPWDYDCTKDVTAWMPLPEPYISKEKHEKTITVTKGIKKEK